MDSDSDTQIDITSSLLGPRKAKKIKTSNSSSSSTSAAAAATTTSSSTSKPPVTSTSVFGKPLSNSEGEEDDGDLFASIASANRARNLSAGQSIIKQRKDSKQTKGLTGGGSFQSLGLPPNLLKALLQRGFTTPTPIQRLALPSILSGSAETIVAGKKMLIARDHLCMARTGSGKTLCYLLPLLAQLGTHSVSYGARGLILVPTRELALQVLKVGKDLARALNKGGAGAASSAAAEGSTSSESLRWAMVVGGEGMEDQFNMMAGNPDVIIATPGRLLHLIVEMSLDLRAVQYCVFDEADRLFELGFAEQLHEILHRMPPTRQTLLFSATLPSTLVGFAKAGLQNPKLIRLDVDSKISKDLQMAYLSVKSSEKEALLLGVLREVIAVPLMTDAQRAVKDEYIEDEHDDEERGRPAFNHASSKSGAKGTGRKGGSKFDPKKKKGTGANEEEGPGLIAGGGGHEKVDPTAHQTLVFVSTKHHVEYITALLTDAGYAVSPIYGSMDQTARRLSLARFRAGRTSILVVTDLAARGIDVPGVENVINYDFPNGTRAFVHRVGRTARAGRKGWAFTFVSAIELPHLLDLELFLSRPVKTCPLSSKGDKIAEIEGHPQGELGGEEKETIDFANQLVLGTGPRGLLDLDLEALRSMMSHNAQLEVLGNVARRGQKMYERGLSKASPESYRRAKELERKGHGLSTQAGEHASVHPIFDGYQKIAGTDSKAEQSRADLLKIINGFRPTETVFEVGTRGKTVASQLMKDRRKAMLKSERARALVDPEEDGKEPEDRFILHDDEEEEDKDDALSEDEEKATASKPKKRSAEDMDDADEEELASVFGAPRKRQAQRGAGASYRDPNFYMGYEQEGADTERGYSLTNGDSFVAQAAQSQYDVAGRGDTEGTPVDATLQRASALRWDRRTKKFVRGDGVGADNKKLVRSESGQKLPASFKSGVFDEWKRKQRIFVPKVGEAELRGKTTTSGLSSEGKKYRHKAGVPRAEAGAEKNKGRTVGQAGGKLLNNAADIRKERAAKAKRVARSTQPSKKGGASSNRGGSGGGGRGGRGGGRGGRGGGRN